MKKTNAEQAIKKARVQLLLTRPFFGNLALNLKVTKNNQLPFGTMAVDGEGNLYYDETWVQELSEPELEFVLCHEVLHLALRHLTRREGRSCKTWFAACDYAVNQLLCSLGIGKMPVNKKTGEVDGLLDQKYNGWSAERIYNYLKELDEGHVGGCTDGKCGEESALGDGRANGKCRKESGDGEGEEWHFGGGFDVHKDVNTNDLSAVEERWKNAVARAATSARMQGKLPANMQVLIGELLCPKVDWRTVLWQFLNMVTKDDYRWFPPNRRHIHNGFNFPSLRSESFEIAVAVDTSGSITDEELRVFLSEVQAILEMNPSCTVHFFECDADIHSQKEYHAGDKIDCKVHGGGGTDFRPVFDAIAKSGLDIPCLVYLTDGYGTYPTNEPNYNVLWVLTSDYDVPFGEKVLLEGEKKW